MSASATFPLRYVLPTTALNLRAVLRSAVVVDPKGGHLEPEVAVWLSAPWHPEPLTTVRRVVTTKSGNGAGGSASSAAPGSLRRTFDRAHPRTAALIADLAARAEQYLAGLRMGEESTQVVTFGQALEVVHRELAAADRARREWVSRQGCDVRSHEWDLSGSDMISVDGSPSILPADVEIPEGRAQELAREYGLLVAICTDQAQDGRRMRDESAAVVVYRRSPDDLPDHPTPDPERSWVRDDGLSRLRLADAGDPAPDIPAQRGSDAHRPVVPYLGQPLTGDPAVEVVVRAGRIQLALLESSDEYSRLASTQYRADEIAALQHEMRLAYMPRQRRGD